MNAPDNAALSREYNNRELVPDHGDYFARWKEASERARNTMACKLDLRYGEAPGETIDLFPARKGDGTCMLFIHGGYWRSLDKADFSYLAPVWVDSGVSLAVVNYDLCPKVGIEEIVRQMLRASRWLWLHAEDYGMDQDRLYVSGHSAGGHLTAMMMAAVFPVFDRRLPKDLFKGGLAISGIYDMRPLTHVDFLQQDLRLDEDSAWRLSPAFLPPATRAPLATCVGGDESGEFRRQNALLGERWKNVLAANIPMPGRNHFSVMDALAEPSSALFKGARRLMKLDQ
ncbi:MAG TPA: alpha/beta hydrolase [Burkholderiales bacterium]|nr:alpha/beta hydrolase [Burkholderiales bacterium]